MFRTKLVVGLVIVALAGLVSIGHTAEMKGKMAAGLGGGLNLPMGDFGDVFKAGFFGGGNFEYFVTNTVGLGATIRFNTNKPKSAFEVPGIDIKEDILQYGAYGKFLFPAQKMEPYVTAGLGFYNQKATAAVMGLEVSASETDIGINGGAGITFPTSEKMGIFVEGLFHNIFSEGSSTTYLAFGAGVRFLFGGSATP